MPHPRSFGLIIGQRQRRATQAGGTGRSTSRGLPSLLVLLLAGTAPVLAHNPHDPIDALALSPAYSSDGLVFTAQLPADNYGTQDPLVSRNGGWTWSGMPAGMNNRSSFSSVSVSPRFAEDGTLFYTTLGDGVFRSVDGGASWRRVNRGLPVRRIVSSALAVNEDGGLSLYVAAAVGGLYRSLDLGESWEKVNPGTIIAIGISPDFELDSTLWVAENGGALASSADGGDSWVLRSGFPGAGRTLAMTLTPGFAETGEMFLGTERAGVVRSTDFGATFVPADLGLLPEPVTAIAASPEYVDDRTLFATTTDHAVFRTTDGGDLWSHFDVDVRLAGQASEHFGVLRVSDGFAVDRTIFLGSFEGLLKSANAGVTWRKLDTRPPGLVTALALSPDLREDATLAVSTYGGGAYVSEDRGASWRVANVGLGESSLYDALFDRDADGGAVLYSNQRNAVLRSLDAGLSWDLLALTRPAYPTEMALSPPLAGERTIFLGTREDGLLRSRDGGETWPRVWPEQPGEAPGISSVVISPEPADRTIFLATWTGDVVRSTDAGASWESVGGDLPPTDDPAHLAISPGYASDRSVVVGTAAGLFGSNDGGDSWAALGDDPAVSEGIVEWVGFSPSFTADRTIMASIRGSGLFRSEDGGASWARIASGLLDTGIQFVEIEFSSDWARDGILYGASDTAVLRSADRGESWQLLAISPVRFEDTRQGNSSPSIDYSQGDWTSLTRSQASANTHTASENRSADVGFSFFGTAVSWVGGRGANLGIAEVWIDGLLVAEVDAYGPQAEYAIPLYAAEGLSLGVHRIRLVVTGRRNPASAGNWIILDAFDVTSRPPSAPLP